jgi:enamine deaminase RidA (YjgF/YER057c/UK114 family)
MDMKRKVLFSGTEWEETVGYSRGVHVGNVIEISGTISMTNNGEIVGEGDPFFKHPLF